MEIDKIRERFANIPVAINNYYGDPTLQWDNTLYKIENLVKEGHKGIIAILTKGYISTQKAKQLKSFGYDKLLIMPAFSHLKVIEIENNKERYLSVENLLSEQIRVLPNIRPLIMGYNDKAIPSIFHRLSKIGIKKVVIAGIRGNDEILLRSMTDKEAEKYTLRVKIIPKELGIIISESEDIFDIKAFKRVSCGIASIFNQPSHNPYWNSPSLAGCLECSLKHICYDKYTKSLEVPEYLKKFLNVTGYKWERGNSKSICTVGPEKRLECPSCCTACYIHCNNTIIIKNKPVSLGTLAFLRFLFKEWTFTHVGIKDNGSNNVSVVYMPNLIKILPRLPEAVNSWYVLARHLDKCYGCSYCIVDAYKPEKREHGISPMKLFNYIEKIWH